MEGEHTDRISLIQYAVLAALGCTKIDYRSLKKMDEAALQIANFVEQALAKNENEDMEELDEIRRLLGIDGSDSTALDVLRAHPDWQT